MKGKLLLLALTLFLSSSCISCSEMSNDAYGKRTDINSSPIAIPNLHLNYFSKGRKDLLLRYLASSSEWHVTSVNGSLLALKRESGSPCDPLDMPSAMSYPDGKIPFSGGGIFFNLSPDINQPWYGYPENRVDEDTTNSLKMEKWHVEKRHSIDSSLVVESHDKLLNLSVSEESDDISRQSTRKTLIAVSHELEKLANSKSMSNQEIDSSILPPGSVKFSRNRIISIKEGKKSSFKEDYVISGYINQGKKGFIYINLIANNGSEEGFQRNTSGSNAEYVGWSVDPDKKFNFCLGVRLNGALSESEYKKGYKTVTFDVQLWFHPSDDSPESMIFRQSITVPGYRQ